MFDDTCEIKGCSNKAAYVGSLPESGIINMCKDCYNRLYKR